MSIFVFYRCVVVEDSAIGLAAAKAAGMTCIVTKSGYVSTYYAALCFINFYLINSQYDYTYFWISLH